MPTWESRHDILSFTSPPPRATSYLAISAPPSRCSHLSGGPLQAQESVTIPGLYARLLLHRLMLRRLIMLHLPPLVLLSRDRPPLLHLHPPLSLQKRSANQSSILRTIRPPGRTIFIQLFLKVCSTIHIFLRKCILTRSICEALQKHPPTATWKVEHSSVDDTTDEQAEYYRIIQDYILKKTGKPHSLEQILERISLAFPSPMG